MAAPGASGGVVTWESAIENLRAMFPDKATSDLERALESTG